MIQYEKLLVLANSMVKMDTLLPGERVIIFNDGENKIVLEGNRRTSIYQMLLDRSLIPLETRASFPIATDRFISEISHIPVDVVASREEAMAFLAARHIVGVEKWSSVSKWRISYEYYRDGSSINEIATRLVMSANKVRGYIRNYKVLLRGLDSATWTKEEKEKLDFLNIKPDRLIRILALKDSSDRLETYYSEDYNLLSNKFDKETITKLIVLLTKMAFVTGEINTRATIDDVWDKIVSAIPELGVPPTEESTNENSGGTDTPNGSGSTHNAGEGFGGGTPPHNGENNGAGAQEHPRDNGESDGETGTAGTGGKKNIPYFFEGLQYGHLDSNDNRTHGVVRVCYEIKMFSNRKLVKEYPLAAAFLTRSLIEQSLIYYAKTNTIQGQQRLIWDVISKGDYTPQLKDIISNYKKNLSNYITDSKVRQYFSSLFNDYDTTANPLNWVIHRPDDFMIESARLIELPSNGLLCVINHLLKH